MEKTEKFPIRKYSKKMGTKSWGCGTSNVPAQPPSGTRSLVLYNDNNNNHTEQLRTSASPVSKSNIEILPVSRSRKILDFFRNITNTNEHTKIVYGLGKTFEKDQIVVWWLKWILFKKWLLICFVSLRYELKHRLAHCMAGPPYYSFCEVF